jgi:hypothetical protein
MTKARSHLLDVYGTQLHVATTKAEWRRLCKQFTQITPADLEGRGYTALFGQGGVVHLAFYVHAKMPAAKRIETAAHEATHGAALLLEDLSAKYDGLSEPFAYLVGWLTRWLWEATA